MVETYKIKDMEQIRLLSDPLKLQLLQAFAAAEKTTKQVAGELGQGVTRLYRHVDALHEAGLLEIIRETPKRGTVERTFRAVAQRFEVDRSLFSEKEGESGSEAIEELLQAGQDEILQALEVHDESNDDRLILTRMHLRASPERVAELRQTLADWLASVEALEDGAGEDCEEAGVLIAFYPVGASLVKQPL